MANADPVDVTNPLSRRYQRSPDFVWRRIGDEYILVPIRRLTSEIDNIYTTNEVAGRIWELIDPERDTAEILDAIVEEFDVNAEQAESDLLQLLSQLEQAGAVLCV